MTGLGRLQVVVAVLTFRRPADLAATVPRLLEQAEQVTSAPDSLYETSVLVIDNDPAATAAEVAATFTDHPLRYVVERTPGIAAARNRALAESDGADLLVFIDDDEVPQSGWLSALLQTQQRTGAAAVAGAVISEFTQPPDRWLSEGGFFVRRRLATGTRISEAATNNLLLDLRTVRGLGLRFDLDFGLSGGEDTLFTRALSASGNLLVWCDEAVVTDQVPASRATRRWVLWRAVSSGNSQSRVALRLAVTESQSLTARLRLLYRGGPRILGGLGRYLFGRVSRSVRHEARGLRTLARGAGMVSGAFGYVYQEYRRD